MDEPARKRRRTTPPEPVERATSPLKKPPRRPSFASPTKASLARFNPNLLPARPTSSSSDPSRPASRGETLNRGKQARAFRLGGADERSSREATNRTEESAEATAGAQEPRLSKAQNITPRARKTDARTVRGIQEEEAELPTSPSSRALVEQDTPRRGVLYSSPSKRPPRVRDGAGASAAKPRGREGQDGGHVQMSNDAEVIQGDAKKYQPPDPKLEEKKREKEQLLREAQDLKRDISLCSDQIQRLQNLPTDDTVDTSEQRVLVSLINKISDADATGAEEQMPPVSSLLCSFLPFTAQAIAPPQWRKDRELPIPSHRPLDLDNPLPYLEMFTPFKFTSNVSIPETVGVDTAIWQSQQKHTIDIVGPQRLLQSSMDAIVDTPAYEVTSLQVSRLSNWAERELGRFVHGKAQEKDLSSICWAISSYWELAKKRAEYWHKCEMAFAHLIPGRTSDDSENVGQTDGKLRRDMSRKELLRHLGRDVFVLEDRHVLLKIAWSIGFDWTGEAQSAVSVEPAFPKVWTEVDATDNLKKIPETFDTLLQSRGVFDATRTMVALLFST